jgi:hypothetical protein
MVTAWEILLKIVEASDKPVKDYSAGIVILDFKSTILHGHLVTESAKMLIVATVQTVPHSVKNVLMDML